MTSKILIIKKTTRAKRINFTHEKCGTELSYLPSHVKHSREYYITDKYYRDVEYILCPKCRTNVILKAWRDEEYVKECAFYADLGDSRNGQ